jgi:chromosome segregation ATPase
LKDYAYAQKAEFIATMRERLDAINREIDELAVKVENSNDSVKAEAQGKLQELRNQTAKLTTQLDDAQEATASTWDDIKAGFWKTYSSLESGFNQARQWVSDKIAPAAK